MTVDKSGHQSFFRDELVSWVKNILLHNGADEEQSEAVAVSLVQAEIDGHKGHGLARLSAYTDQLKSGKVFGQAKVLLEKVAPSVLQVDAGDGFAFLAIKRAIKAIVGLTKIQGISVALISRSHHAGAIGQHVESIAEHGLIGLMCVNTPKAMAPWGALKPVFGTNPIAFAVPRVEAPPLVIDLSLSKVARGRVMRVAQDGGKIPEGWALDKNGKPTTNPEQALEGSMVPLGDAKGSALALMVEILAGSLTGSNHSYETGSFFSPDGPCMDVGQFILAIDSKVQKTATFHMRIEELFKEILSDNEGQLNKEDRETVRLPGSARLERREFCQRNGIFISHDLLVVLNSLSKAKS